jgi:ADP-L-glycero-D-manno-heptose 6-epimerase
MLVITGGAGFIGSVLVGALNQQGRDDIIIVDNLGSSSKWLNLRKLKFLDYLSRERFLELVESEALAGGIEAIVHLGACSTTTEENLDFLFQNNFAYSRTLADYAVRKKIRFIYASSAATYGDGKQGYSDDTQGIPTLLPLNRYGYSKQRFDLWVLREGLEKMCVGLKFFNVYGPNEYHKSGQHSVVYSAFQQAQACGRISLFESYQDGIAHGEQKRDFVYVKDCVQAMLWFLAHPHANGIFNLGCGQARSFNDLAKAVFAALRKPVQIDYISMPQQLRAQYQYFTQANLNRLNALGYTQPFTSLEQGVEDYVRSYLLRNDQYF